MRRLTLILSDLYLPAGADRRALPAALDLPNLDALLRFAQSVEGIDDWRQWLARDLGAGALANLPAAHLVAAGAGIPSNGTWLAAPVALEARLDHVRLRDDGLLRLSPEESAAWQEEFARTFGPELQLVPASERSFLLTGGPSDAIRTVDPARLLDADIGGVLPTDSAAARALRKLGTEIEMWLHSAGTNSIRERAGLRRISALWLWGGGPVSPVANASDVGWVDFQIQGGDPCVSALANLGASRALGTVAARFADIPAGSTDLVVELAPLSGDGEASLASLDSKWFAPIRAALGEGSLERFTLAANDRVYDVHRGASWKFWRPRKRWLEYLGA